MSFLSVEVDSKNELERYLKRIKRSDFMSYLEQAGRRGVEMLALETPKDTGATAASWSYSIEKTNEGYQILFHNSNAPNGVPVVILIQYGHATRNGGFVEPYDFVNPVTKRLMDELAEETWLEVTK